MTVFNDPTSGRPPLTSFGHLLRARPLSSPALLVALLGAALTGAYCFATTAMFLPRLFPARMTGADWMTAAGGRREAAVAYVVFAVSVSVLYLAALSVAHRQTSRVSRGLLLGFPLLFVAALLLMYPPTAADLFHYHADARTQWIHDRNPLVVSPLETASYPTFIPWAEVPSPYGPMWSLLTTLLAPLMVVGDHHLATLIGFKVIASASFLGCAWLIYRMAEEWRAGAGMLAFVLFAWNPFVLMRAIANGHNDLTMMFFALLALFYANRREWTYAFPLMAVSLLIKFATAWLGPPLLLFAWCAIEGTAAQRARMLMPGLALAVLVVVVSYYPFWAGLETFASLRTQAGLMITSTPDLLRSLFWGRVGEEVATVRVRLGTTAVFVVLALALTWQARKGVDHLVVAGASILLLYLVLAVTWFRPWYMLWPAAVIAIRPSRWGVALFLAITISNLFPDLIEHYRYDWGIRPDVPARGAPLIAQFVPPVLVWIAGALKTRSLHLGSARAPLGTGGGAALAAASPPSTHG